MATRVDRAGVENCVASIRNAIQDLETAANNINNTMNQLPSYWEGDAYNKASSTYEAEYKNWLTQTVPETVESLKAYIDDCTRTIVELDAQLAGR